LKRRETSRSRYRIPLPITPSDGVFPARIEVADRPEVRAGVLLLKHGPAQPEEVTDLSGIEKVRRLPGHLRR
jgi:hypothetical protein